MSIQVLSPVWEYAPGQDPARPALGSVVPNFGILASFSQSIQGCTVQLHLLDCGCVSLEVYNSQGEPSQAIDGQTITVKDNHNNTGTIQKGAALLGAPWACKGSCLR